jgi:hypothetical protein
VILSPWVETDILSCAFAILSVLALWPLIFILHLSFDLRDSTNEAMTNVALSYHLKNFAIQQSHITTMTQITIRSKSHEGTPKKSCHTVYPQIDRPTMILGIVAFYLSMMHILIRKTMVEITRDLYQYQQMVISLTESFYVQKKH